jgi:hypothetical protein
MNLRKMFSVLTIVSVLVATTAFAYVQVQNLASTVNGCVTVDPLLRAAAADTGAVCTIVGYKGAAVVVNTGLVDNVTTSVYAVLQDSVTGSAWASNDSIAVDSVNNKYYDLHYRPTRNANALRVLFRASAGATDTITAGATIVRLCSDRPC